MPSRLRERRKPLKTRRARRSCSQHAPRGKPIWHKIESATPPRSSTGRGALISNLSGSRSPTSCPKHGSSVIGAGSVGFRLGAMRQSAFEPANPVAFRLTAPVAFQLLLHLVMPISRPKQPAHRQQPVCGPRQRFRRLRLCLASDREASCTEWKNKVAGSGHPDQHAASSRQIVLVSGRWKRVRIQGAGCLGERQPPVIANTTNIRNIRPSPPPKPNPR